MFLRRNVLVVAAAAVVYMAGITLRTVAQQGGPSRNGPDHPMFQNTSPLLREWVTADVGTGGGGGSTNIHQYVWETREAYPDVWKFYAVKVQPLAVRNIGEATTTGGKGQRMFGTGGENGFCQSAVRRDEREAMFVKRVNQSTIMVCIHQHRDDDKTHVMLSLMDN